MRQFKFTVLYYVRIGDELEKDFETVTIEAEFLEQAIDKAILTYPKNHLIYTDGIMKPIAHGSFNELTGNFVSCLK